MSIFVPINVAQLSNHYGIIDVYICNLCKFESTKFFGAMKYLL